MMHLLALVCAVVACGCRAYPRGGQTPDADSAGSFPLKVWMAANLARPMKTQDVEALNGALSLVASNAPSELPGWAAIADRGARAAAAGDVERVRQCCSDCHDTYRKDYRERFRSRPFPLHATRDRSTP